MKNYKQLFDKMHSPNDTEDEDHDTDIKTCSLCKAQLTPLEFDKHLCIDQESIVCPCSKAFKSTASLLKHIVQHIEVMHVTDKRLLYKCHQCRLGYPMEILLECHKKSHKEQQPKSVNQPSAQSSSIGGHSKNMKLNTECKTSSNLIRFC